MLEQNCFSYFLRIQDMVKEACRLKDEKELKESILSKDKLEMIKNEDCRRKCYIEKITLFDTGILFQHRTRMTKNAGNYRGWGKYKKEGAMCKFCLKYDNNFYVIRREAFFPP